MTTERSHLEHLLYKRSNQIPSFVWDYIEDLYRTHSISTRYEYIKDIQLFFEYLIQHHPSFQGLAMHEIHFQQLKDVTEEDAERFLEYLHRYEKSFHSVAGNLTIQFFHNSDRGLERKRSVLSNFFHYCIVHHQLLSNPFDLHCLVVQKYEPQPILADFEIDRLQEVAEATNENEFRGLRNKVIIQLLACMGLRIQELTSLNIEDIWEERHELVIRRKNGEQDIVAIPEEIKDTLYQYMHLRKQEEYVKKEHRNALFLSQQKQRINPRSVRKMLRVVAGYSGIQTPVTPQVFRRTFAWNLRQKGKELEEIAAFLGNQSTETVKYMKVQKKKS